MLDLIRGSTFLFYQSFCGIAFDLSLIQAKKFAICLPLVNDVCFMEPFVLPLESLVALKIVPNMSVRKIGRFKLTGNNTCRTASTVCCLADAYLVFKTFIFLQTMVSETKS